MKKFLVGLACVACAVACAFSIGSVQADRAMAADGASSVANLNMDNLANGIAPEQSKYFDINTPLPQLPRTVEAVFTINKSFEGRSGILVGNHRNSTGDSSFNFEIQWDSSGKFHYPKLYYIDGPYSKSTGTHNVQINFNFTGVKLTAGTQYHLVIVHDTYKGEARCYVNGTYKQTISRAGNSSHYGKYVGDDGEYLIKMDRGLRVGGDYRNQESTRQNDCYFKGAIKHLAFYEDVRSDTEILGDAKRVVYDYAYDDHLIFMYDFTQPNPDYLKDLSGNGYDITYTGEQKYASAEEGLVFSAKDKYVIEKKHSTLPSTYEAVIYLPKGVTGRGGVIVGNYKDSNSACFSLEVYNDGVLRVYTDTDKNTGVSDARLTDVDVRTGDWVHVALVHDKASQRLCAFLDGKLVQEVSYVPTSDLYNNFDYQPTCNTMIGGDARSGNGQYFKGIIKSVALYDYPKSVEEITASLSGVDVTDKGLMGYYDLSSASAGCDVLDKSLRGNHLRYEKEWVKPEDKPAVKDYAYSFAVVGDTQWMNYCYNDKFAGIYEWIIENKQAKKIQYVFGLGDVTEKDKDWEWSTAKNAISKMDGVLPYSVVRGNHDTKNGMQAFNYDAYTKQFDGFYQEGDLANTYRKITVGSTKYLMITLDYGANDSVLAWAGKLCQDNPDHKVIVTTHAYMYRDGTTLDQGDVCPPATTGGSNNGDHIWDKFVSKYENIMLVMSGHDPCDDIVVRQERGVNGNMVTQMLIDHQYTDRDKGGNGMVAMLYFSEDGSSFEVECYSTVRESFYKESNQFTVCLNGHAYVNKNASEEFLCTPATCEKPAVYYYSCSCGAVGENTFSSGEPLQHVFDRQVIVKKYLATPATCSDKATYYYSCSCGAIGQQTFQGGELNPDNHVFNQKITEKKYYREPATCSEAETYYYACKCGLRGTNYYENGQPTGVHLYDQQVAEDKYIASPATCTQKAEYYYSCRCGEAGEQTFTSGSFAAHSYDKQVAEEEFLYKKATCVSPAAYYYSCECGAKSTETFTLGEADGHQLADTYTCHDRVCSKCNVTISASTQHSYGEGEITVQPTTSTEGERKYTCACGATKTEKIDKLEGGSDEGGSCATVAPVGGGGFGGGALMIVITALAVTALTYRKRRN